MKSNWNKNTENKYIRSFKKKKVLKDLAQRIYTTHLLGKDPKLVLHGGGNTSVKSKIKDIQGKIIDVMYVKGSGWDMSNLSEEGMPGVELQTLKETKNLKKLSDLKMVNHLRKNLINIKSPNPSVETLLHAYLPHKYIDHTHSSAILSIVNQKNSKEICKKIYGNKLGIVPYIMPGFDLSLKSYNIFKRNKKIEGLILLNHGIFTFGNTAEQSYKRMIKYVTLAEKFLKKKKEKKYKLKKSKNQPNIKEISVLLRNAIYSSSNYKWILNFFSSKDIVNFTLKKDFLSLLNKGPVTPDHVIRIKPFFLILNSKNKNSIKNQVERFSKKYTTYFLKNRHLIKGSTKTDSIPRIIILPGVGIYALGRNNKETKISLDIFISAFESIKGAYKLNNFKSIPTKEIFKMEYWPLERAKISQKKRLDLEGNVVVISGGCGTIGTATAKEFLDEGAEVVLLDNNNNNIKNLPNHIKKQTTVIKCNVTNHLNVKNSLNKIIKLFGGIDIIISNAGKAFQGNMAEVNTRIIKESYDVNFFSHQYLAQESVKIFIQQNIGGLILFNISKQSINPGKNFGPYGLPKSSTLFLMKQYALEYGKFGIRFNGINADRIESGILNKKLINERAKARGLPIKIYMKGNLLQTVVEAKDVARAFLYQAKLIKTTGNIITVDGGNIEASLR